MPDPTPTPTPTPTPAPAPASGSRGQINQAWLDEFTTAEAIAAAALQPAQAASLATGGISADTVAALTAAIVAACKLAGLAVQGTTGKMGITDAEEALKQTLIQQIQNIQKRARQKYDATAPGKLADYAVAQKFYSSRSLLEQTAANILLKLRGDAAAPADVLPGVDAAKIAALAQALTDYKNVQGDQTEAQGGATAWRKQVESAVTDIVAKRREIQFAADAEWPHTVPANAGIRKEFKLPPDRVMK